MRALLALMPSLPALLLGRRNDLLAWNPLGHALVAGHLASTDPATRPDQMRLLFCDRRTRELHRDGRMRRRRRSRRYGMWRGSIRTIARSTSSPARQHGQRLLTHTAAVGSAAADALALLG